MGSSPIWGAKRLFTPKRKTMFENDLYKTLAQSLPGLGIMLFDHSFRYVMVMGDDILASSGLTSASLIGKQLAELEFPGSFNQLESAYQDALNGRVRDIEVRYEDKYFTLRVSPVKSSSGHINAGVVIVNDITEAVKNRAMLEAMSVTDELTSIYNRRGFMLLASQQLKLANRSQIGSMVFFIDLNDLKLINDNSGHKLGDEALKATARVLSRTFRESDIVARYGGDEFVIYVSNVEPHVESIFRKRLQEEVDETNKEDLGFRLSFSIGHTYFDPETDDRNIDELITAADESMYTRKRARKLLGSDRVRSNYIP